MALITGSEGGSEMMMRSRSSTVSSVYASALSCSRCPGCTLVICCQSFLYPPDGAWPDQPGACRLA
jgi:hypothetical protein